MKNPQVSGKLIHKFVKTPYRSFVGTDGISDDLVIILCRN